jgi:serine/threonine protein phosphatase 1
MAWVENGAAALLGNHDELFLEWLAGHEDIFYYGRIGGLATINSFLAKMGLNSVGYTELLDDNGKEREIRRRIIESFQGEISFLKERPLFMESREMIFVHAGIDPKRGLHKSYRQELLNIRDEFIYHYDGERTVVFGHTRTRKIHGSDEVYFGENRIIGIDGGCAFGGQLNALIIEDGGYDTAAVKKSTDITGRSR